MTFLFDRAVTITIARPIQGEFFREQPNAILIRDLRVQFTVEKQLSSDPNNATVIITNLAQQTIGELQRRPLIIRVDAGYANDPKRLFQGDLRRATSKREDTDWNTELEVGDGERAYRFARVNRSYKPGTKEVDIIREAASAMGTTLRSGSLDLETFSREFATGTVMQGSARRELDRITGRSGTNWSIQNGELQVLNQTQTVGRAILMTARTGVLGSPEFGTPKNTKETPLLTVRSLLRPEINPGSLVRVETRTINGTFRVQKVTHSGDSRGDDWSTECECKTI